jgi:hypothetical protein
MLLPAFSPLRATRSLLAAAGALVVLSGSLACNESSLTQLRPDFNIVWEADRGFNDEVDHIGILTDSVLQFSSVTTGEISVTEIQISNPGDKGLELCALELVDLSFDGEGDERELANEMVSTSAEISHNGTTGSLAPGETFSLELRFTPLFGTALPDTLHLSVKHELNWDCDAVDSGDAGTGEGLYIPIFGAGDGEPVPDIYANPDQLEFADVTLGDGTVQELASIVGNAGPGLLEVAAVTIGDETNFSLDATALENTNFAMGESAEIRVEFSPQAQGNLSTVVSVFSNDPNESPLEIPVFGVSNAAKVGKAPVAVCGPTIQSAPFQTEQLDGTASYDPSGLPLTFNWTFTPPGGSNSYLDNTASATPTTTILFENYGLDLAGTYTGVLVVSNSQGSTSQPCTQEIIATPNENFRVELFWSQPDDMDLHLLKPGGGVRTDGDCYFSNCVGGFFGGLDWGVAGVTTDDPSLDLDDIQGTGPENTNIVAPAVGAHAGDYTVFVHDYPGTVDEFTGTDCTVNIYLNGVLMQTYNFTITGENEDYYVAKITWPSGAIAPCSGLGGC